MRTLLTSMFLFGFLLEAQAQNFYDANTIQSINIRFTQSNWDYMLDTSKAGAGEYIMADSVYINGVGFDSVGVKYKGNSSYNASQTKNPFHIELDTYKDQDYLGIADIKLSNISFDPSFVREVVAYKILANYMDCPSANFANVYVNGSLMGLYTNTEPINKAFVNEHFGSKSNAFFSCSPPDGAGPQTTNLPTLAYLGANSSSYTSAYEIKSDSGWTDLINLTNILSTTTAANTANIEAVLDIDRVLWMLAFDNLTVNLDSYIGQFKQNYYLYKADNGQFMPIVWDLNMSFGVFGSTGSTTGGPGGGSLTTATKKTLSHTLHSTESTWPLVQKLLAVPTYKKRYLAHYKTILTEMIANGTYLADATTFQNLILASVTADINKFSYQTVANLTANRGTTDISAGGMNTAPGLTGLMSDRNTYLAALADFTNTQPTISNVGPSNATPTVGTMVTITANVSNSTTTSVYLGYRIHKNDIFVKTQMFDDGAHNDGAAGDNVYGAAINVSNAITQYYIYAENTNIGAFSPARAEYEYHILNSTYPTLAAGQLVVNEIMASNSTTATDPNGDYEDWFELYNNTANTLSLDNLYATDDATNLQKWQFPAGTTIAPYSYLIVWADQDLTEAGIHANFKFSANGESCILSYANGVIVDSVAFGAQTTDMGYARVPNGTGNFLIQAPTFNANNSPLIIGAGQLAINEIMADNSLTAADQDGEFEDWIELYNNSSDTLFLDDLYATNDPANLLKWQFPAGTTLAPNSYLILWADQDTNQTGLHTNFSLAASGQSVILSYDNGTIIDSISFGSQTTDRGYARVPNGTGSFLIQAPTFNINNETIVPVGINQLDGFNSTLKMYPNPTNSILTLSNQDFLIESIQVSNIQGQILYKINNANVNQITIDFSDYTNGMYFITVNNQTNLKLVKY